MTNDWQVKRLDEVATFLNGLWKGKTPPFARVGVIRNTNFAKDGTLDDSDIAFLEVEVRQLATRKLMRGDLILEKSGGGPKQAVGRVVLFDKEDGDFSFSNFTSAIRINDLEQLDASYLHLYLYWFYTSGMTEPMQSHSTGIRNLNGNAYKALQVTFPPIDEQQRIVAVLNVAFAGIAAVKDNIEKNIQNARELFESDVENLFTALSKSHLLEPLSSLCVGITVGHVGSMAARYTSKGIPFLRSQNIRPFRVDLDAVVYIDEEFHGELKKSTLRPGDVAIVRTGYPGTAAVIPDCLPIANCSDLVIVRPGARINPHYMTLFFNSRHGKNAVAGKLVGAAQKHFNVTAAKQTLLPMPPMDEQLEIVEAFGSLRQAGLDLERSYARKLTQLDTLKQSLLARAFAGEL